MNGKPVFTRHAKTVINFKSGFAEKLLCDGPTFSLGDACVYSCSFCYVPAMMQKAAYIPKGHKHTNMVVRRENALDVLYSQLKSLKPAIKDQVLTIYSSALVDVAANMDLVKETTLACCQILTDTRWHIRLLSKSNLLPKIAQSLMDLARDGKHGTEVFTQADVQARLIFGVSTGTLDDDQAAAFEQGCPKPSKRIESLHWLQDHGFRTFGMLCPTLPQRNYTQSAQDLLHAIRPEKCEHIWAEVMNVRGDSLRNTIAALHHAGYEWQSNELQRVSQDTAAWEHYAHNTFLALVNTLPFSNIGKKLRFLQYVTPKTRDWWLSHEPDGAILLGAASHP
jgi:DNA repair photolyase